MKQSTPIQKARVKLADVARAAGVSLSTVSLVLNDKPLAKNLATATRQRIRVIAEQLNYRPDAAARSLRSRRSQLIGVMVFDIADPYCTLILQGIQETLGDAALLPIIMDANNQRQQFSRYLGMAVEHHVEALIVVANWLFVDIDTLRRFERNGIPTVIVGREFPSTSISSVLVDNEAGGRIALEHLHQLGHTKIAVIRGPERLQDSERRWRGIEAAARAAGLKLDPHLVLQLPETADPVLGYSGGYEAAKQLIATNRKFTGVLAFDDLTAFGVIRGLHEVGLNVPGDISVVGFDDIPQAILTMPSLTTVSQHMRRMGMTAADRVLESIHSESMPSKTAGKHAKSFILLQAPTLVARESTAVARDVAVKAHRGPGRHR